MLKPYSLTDQSLIDDISHNSRLMGDDHGSTSERLSGEITVLAMFTVTEKAGLE
jgi:hypothetical protein